ncbi:uncharacterized protein K02A2.6-like [Galleria mellonella]|uniref:RNA-directed DNA polymerase n=1 Tax=Galleria mellonella TaxID=7137 RepID=A0ABM3MJE1_GALME|nr:uncharacterized protein K02A2.6-like [Galleria mellonella]
MEHARPPAELNMDGGPVSRADAWKKWKQQFMLFLKASGVASERSSVQASLMVNLIGPDGFDVYQTFTFDEDSERDDVAVLMKKFDNYFGTKPNVTLMRYKFFTRNQDEGESIQQYVTALRLLSKTCEFTTLEEELIRDRIVCGIRHSTVRDRLLRRAQESCRQIGSSGDTARVDAVSARGRGRSAARSWPRRAASGAARGINRRGPAADALAPRAARSPCRACGSARCSDSECPAQRVSCYVCGNHGHFARMCKSNNFFHNAGRARAGRVYGVECDVVSSEPENDIFYISSVDCGDHSGGWFQILTCENGHENFKLDSGADCNIISYSTFLKLGFDPNIIVKKNISLLSYTHDTIPLKGICTIPWYYKNIIYNLKFAVADIECSSVLGRNSCEELGLIKRIMSIELSNYNDLFKGLGCLPGKYHIVTDSSVPPVICASRKIPHGLRDRLAQELNKMVDLGVIRKVNHPTQWVHPLVLVAKKDNGIRVCLDPRELNRAIQRAHFQLPTVSELASRLHGARYFSVLDANAGFWAVVLDDESADLCTFSTPFGRYKFLRLPFGVNCASEVFHAKLRQHLEDLEGVDNYVDDVIVWGETRQIHDMRLKALLNRAKEINLKFNKQKCKIGVQEVTYLGHVFDSKGMRPDYNKIKAIKEMQIPKDKKDLERFLGAVNYLSKFIPNYSEIAIPLTSLLKKNNYWRWEDSEQSAFDQLKECVCGAGVLALYNPTQPVRLSVDASQNALGAVLMQGGRPVEYASRTLTDAQTRYAQVEKEMLAIVFGCERFHQYIYGQKGVIVESDHKPLEGIFKKPLASVPARLQRMLLRLQCYDLTVTYVPGKYMFIADMLSRAALPDLYSEEMHSNITYQDQVLIPKELREEMLKIVHEGHLGIDRCKRRARQVMFWPSMSRDIEQFVKRCHTCQEHSNRPAKEPLLPMEIPALPWEKVLISDNGTQYTSREFKNFANVWGFNHVTSSPNYPQANGKSERAVQTIKMILKKSIKSNGDFDLALLNYRNTPRDGLSSPAQLLMGRRLRCQLPVHENLLKPKPVDPSEYQTMLHKQNNNKMYYDQHSKTLPMLREGDSVICIDGKIRSRGKIVGRADAPRSYIVKNSVGARYRRNRRHLIRCESDPQAMHSDHGKDEQFNDACEYSCTSSDEASNLNSEQLIRKAKAVAIQRLRKKL